MNVLRTALVRLVSVVAALVLVTVAIIVVAFVALQNERVRETATTAIARFVPGVEIEGLQAGLPARLGVDRITLSDTAGPWLELDGLHLQWRPGALLDGRLDVARLAADTVRVRRAPEAEPDAAETPAPESGPPGLPSSVFPVIVETLEIDEVRLDAPVIGQPLTLAVTGRLDAGNGRSLTAMLDVVRTDRPGLDAGLDVEADLAAGTLAFDLRTEERSGLIASLSGEPALEPLTLTLGGSGPIDAWPGRLAVEAGSLARLETTLGLALSDPLAIELDGTVAPARDGEATADHPVRRFLIDDVEFALSARTRTDETVLERLELRAPGVAVDGSGRLAAGEIEAFVRAEAPALEAFEPFTTTRLGGRLAVSAAVIGDLAAPSAELSIDGGDLSFGEVELARIDQRIDVDALGDGGFDITAEGEVDGLRVGAETSVFEETLAVNARASVVPGGPFDVRDMRVEGRHFTLMSTARGHLGDGAVDAHLALDVPELVAFRPLLAAAPSGGLELDVEARLEDAFRAGDFELRAAANALAELPPAAMALLGASPALTLSAALEPLPTLAIQDLTLEAANLQAAASGSIDVETLAGTVEATAAVPDLATFDDAVGQALDGTIELNLAGSGSAEDFTAEMALEAPALAVGDAAFDRAALNLTATGSTAEFGGEMAVDAAIAGQAADLAAAYVYARDRFELSNLDLDAPGVAAAGDFDIALAPLSADGDLRVAAPDLAELGRWLGLDLAGRFDLALDLDPAAGQSARLSADGTGLRLAGIGLDELAVEVAASDLLDEPALRGATTLTGLRQAATIVDRAAFSVDGDLTDLRFELAADGGLPEPFRLEGNGTFGRDEAALAVGLNRFEAEFGELPINLEAPTRVVADGPELTLEPLALAIATGRVEASAALGASRVTGDVAIIDVPLAPLASLGAPALAGALDGAFELAGTRASPTVDGRLDLSSLGLADGEDTLGLAASLSLDPTTLEANLATEGLGAPPLVAEARLPVRFALDPFTFEPPAPLPLDATVDGTIDLARLARWYGLDGQDVAGTFTAEIDVAGNAAAPLLDGSVELDDGRFIDFETGIVLDQAGLRVVAQGDRIVLETLAATDGRDGRLEGGGSVSLTGSDATAVAAFDLDARLQRFAVLQSEEVFVVMSGETDVTGSDADIDVFSRFTVEQGEVRIGGGGGAQGFATLDVRTREELEAEAAAPPPQAPGVIGLDVEVDIPGRLFVRGQGLVSEWGGRLRVEGEAAAPRITGLIDYRRGYVDILENRFEFRRGEIRFTGGFPPEPLLNVEATVDLGDTTPVLGVSGTASDPEITITSEPPLPEDEVIARLLFDRNRQQLNPVQAIKLAAALDRLRRGGTGIADDLRTGLGVDTLEFGGETLDDASIRAGTYVNEDVFVEFEQGLQAGGSAARAEVELTPRIRAETRVDQQQSGSVGLRWSLDY